METITLSGGVIFPASPGFYFKQKEIYEVVSDFTNKILHHIGLKQNMKFWNEK
jgi:3-polyprenyl-4-hydroxybenzoate decarboxylase